MATLTLKSTFRPRRMGRVTVRAPDGTVERDYKITEAELEAHLASGNGVPPGLTRDEWFGNSKRCVVCDIPYEVGDCHVTGRGALVIKIAEGMVGAEIVETFVIFNPGDWSGTPPNITIMNPAKDTRRNKNGNLIQSIVNGVVTLR